jgi:hypothetical protein
MEERPSLLNSKLKTEETSLKKHFHNKLEKEKKFQNNWENDRMLKRINDIKNRQNKYMKESQQLMQSDREYKVMH